MRKLYHGWNKDHFDGRDLKAADHFKLIPPSALPPSVLFRWGTPPDQGNLGSCVGHGVTETIQYLDILAGRPEVALSRLFVYYGARLIEGGQDSDCGCEVRDAMQAINAFGVPPESAWPYDISQFAVEPPASVYVAATHNYVIKYYRVGQTENEIKACLAEKYPIVFGFEAFQQFESDECEATGILQMPPTGATSIGGHCVVCDGYDSTTGFYDIRNSYGKDWGQQGYFKMPAAYLQNPGLANDLWTIRATYQGA